MRTFLQIIFLAGVFILILPKCGEFFILDILGGIMAMTSGIMLMKKEPPKNK